MKRSYEYQIPVAIRGEVESQEQDLLQWRLIYPANSQYAHLIVCVAKNDGEMRLYVDYRQLNAVTVPDAFPIEKASELIYDVIQANNIKGVCILRGY